MARIEQALILDPPTELHFKGPLTELVTTSYLNLTNPTDRQVCFKVKTTAPKTYCVRPNSGVVPPKDTVIVAIMLQPVDMEFADRSKHKFMVQTIFAPDGYRDIDQDSLWRKASPESLMNSKLRCVFDEAKETIQTSAEISEHPKEESERIVQLKVSSESDTSSSPQSSNMDATVQNLMNCNKKLKEEMNELVQENSRLKEEGLRLRVSKSGGFSVDSQSGDMTPGSKSQPQQIIDGGEMTNKSVMIIVSIVVLVIGIYLGKNLF